MSGTSIVPLAPLKTALTSFGQTVIVHVIRDAFDAVSEIGLLTRDDTVKPPPQPYSRYRNFSPVVQLCSNTLYHGMILSMYVLSSLLRTRLT